MFQISNAQSDQLLKYLMARPYAEVAQMVAMIASLKQIDNTKDDKSKKDLS